jgi:exosporium-targeted protein
MRVKNYPKGLNLDDFISVGAFDSNLVGPTLPPIPPFTLPTGATGSTGPTGDTGPTGVTDLQVLLELPALQQQLLQRLSFWWY